MGAGMLADRPGHLQADVSALADYALGGYEMARWLHFWLTIAFLGFFAIHVLQVVLAGWNNFRSMVSGREVQQRGRALDRGRTEAMVMDDIDLPGEQTSFSSEKADAEILAASRRHTRRSFVAGTLGAAAAFGLYRYLDDGPQKDMQPRALAEAYQLNAALSRSLFRDLSLRLPIRWVAQNRCVLTEYMA